jgi:hypothetical protein
VGQVSLFGERFQHYSERLEGPVMEAIFLDVFGLIYQKLNSCLFISGILLVWKLFSWQSRINITLFHTR